MSEIIKAPFTVEQIKAIKDYQGFGYLHPLTCGRDECRADLDVNAEGLFCPICGYKQDWVPRCAGEPDFLTFYKGWFKR